MKIFDSLTEKLEEFKPLNNKRVTIYVCGITPYDTTHLGHAFTYISFDSLIRYLKFKGFQVICTQNVTDINDRDHDILEQAKEQNIPWDELAAFWTGKFLKDMDNLNWTPPTHYLYASKQIGPIIQTIQTLLKKSLAYQVDGSVYLDISKFPDYGKLSKFCKEKMIQVSPDFEEDLECSDKRNPLDITLWRAKEENQPAHIPSFDSPFGKGRPGWHIECSAMSISTLGGQIDIHGGGTDLKFPHHEAEIAQSEGATGKVPFAKYWLHTGIVSYQGEKMSKSKGNLVMVSDLLKKYSPNAIRWLLLSHHWSKPWEYKEENLKSAQKNVETIEKTLSHTVIARKVYPERVEGWQSNSNTQKFTEILDQNLNTPEALNFLLELAKLKARELKELYETLGFYTSF